MAFFFIKITGYGDIPDKNSVEFWLNFAVTIFCAFLLLSFIIWVYERIQTQIREESRHEMKKNQLLQTLDILTSEEETVLNLLVHENRLAGTIELPSEATQPMEHLGRLSLIQYDYLGTVGPYNTKYRYRYVIDEHIFNHVKGRIKF